MRCGRDKGQVRFIPACAGNTPGSRTRAAPAPVHPRVCGEHASVLALTRSRPGSSPRVRGTPGPDVIVSFGRRVIPACAGNTGRSDRSLATGPVHPRVCGEHYEVFCRAGRGNGSSPRVRGTQRLERLEFQRHWFIPACAGNTRWPESAARPPPVHPRGCGEHRACSRSGLMGLGSSPRVRGTLVICSIIKFIERFIPACAGNTPPYAGPPAWLAVHPRVCGEHGVFLLPQMSASGSSPRVRGTQVRRLAGLPPPRFIPACAGNTPVS